MTAACSRYCFNPWKILRLREGKWLAHCYTISRRVGTTVSGNIHLFGKENMLASLKKKKKKRKKKKMMVLGRTPLRKRTRRENSVCHFFPWRAEPTTIAPESSRSRCTQGERIIFLGWESKEKVCLQKMFGCSTAPLPHNQLTCLMPRDESFGLQAITREWSETLCYKQEQMPESPARQASPRPDF